MTDPSKPTDLELLLGWRDGDASMGATLFERHKTVVTNLFRRNVYSKSEIPDLVQQTFLNCIDTKNARQIAGSVQGYILGIAFHTMTRFFRRARYAPELGIDEERELTLASIETDPEYLLTLGDERRLLMKALRRVKFEFQAVIELNYWEGIPSEEIASILRIPHPTVRRRLQNGRAALERKLAELSDSPELLAATTMSIHAWQQGIRDLIAHSAALSGSRE